MMHSLSRNVLLPLGGSVLGLLLLGFAPSEVQAQPFRLNVQPEITGPGVEMTARLTEVRPRSKVVLFASLELGPHQVDRPSSCGTISILFDIASLDHQVASGRSSPDGTRTFTFRMPNRLPRGLNGAAVYWQAVSVGFMQVAGDPCQVVTGTSNVASTTIQIDSGCTDDDCP